MEKFRNESRRNIPTGRKISPENEFQTPMIKVRKSIDNSKQSPQFHIIKSVSHFQKNVN